MFPALTRTPSFFAWSIDGKQDSQAAGKVSGNNTLEATTSTQPTLDLYFAAAFLPDVPERATVVTLHNSIDAAHRSDRSQQQKEARRCARPRRRRHQRRHAPASLRRPQGNRRRSSSIHATGADGKPDGPSLEPLIQFGWMTVIAKPLYLVLRFMVEHGIPNWGWAIIIFTVIFNLTAAAHALHDDDQSSLKMMRIQPKVDAIKKRYAQSQDATIPSAPR